MRVLALGLATVSALSTDATPLTKVVTLLKEMKATVEKEMKEDAAIYDKLACWCHTNKEEKSDAVEVANQRIETLKAKIGEYTGKQAQLAAEIKNTKADLAEDEQSLVDATKVREKEAAEFHKLETDNVQAIAQLKSAIVILSRHNESLLQADTVNNMVDVVKHIQYKFSDAISEDDAHSALSMLQSRPYAAQSGEIFGFINSMLESMQKNYADAQAEEAKAVADFGELKAAKTEEIEAGRQLLENKETEHADTSEKLVNAKEDLADTEAALEADTAFLVDLEKRCKANDSEMQARNKVRTEEIAAINDTIGILVSDDTRDVAKRSFNFLQKVKSEQTRYVRSRAASKLKAMAVKHNNPQLAMLATAVQLDAFTKVKKAIDDMVAALKQQQADDVKHKDFCNTEFHTNEQTTVKANRKLEGLQGKQDDLEATIKDLTTDIETLTAEIGDARLELQRATNDHGEATKEFKQVVADQQATQAILDKATKRLSQFYNKKSLLQTSQEPGAKVEGPPPGLEQAGYKKSSASGGVMGMLAEIKNDSIEAENEAKTDQQAAQTAYEEFTANTNKTVAEKQKATVNATENRAQADKELVATKEDIAATMTELEKLSEYNGQLHKACDFTLKNFEVTQKARSEEVEALQQAKSILSGAQ